jgi:hypothetical protein
MDGIWFVALMVVVFPGTMGQVAAKVVAGYNKQTRKERPYDKRT